MPERKSPHDILGVSPDASEEEIRSAFHKAAKKYHPDKQTNQEDREKANLRFNEVNEAYESLISQFRNNYGMEGEQDLNESASSSPRTRPSTGGTKVRKRSSATSTSEKPSSFRSQEGTRSPAANQRKSSIRSPVPPSPTVPKSPGSKKSIRDSIRSPNSGGARPRPSVVGRASSGGSAAVPRKSKSAVGPTPPSRPPLETSPNVKSRKNISPLNSPGSPRRPSSSSFRPRPSASINLNNNDTSLSPRRVSKVTGGHKRHNSLGSLNYNHLPPPPQSGNSPKQMATAKPTRSSSSGNLKSAAAARRGKAPPPPQSTLQRISIKLTNRNELKAEKKARAEKLMQ